MPLKLIQSALTAALLVVTVFTKAQAPTPAAERLRGLERKAVLQRASVLDSVRFRNIGPSIMSGRVVDLAVNPADPTEMYVAYATGGLWYSHNNAQSFTPVFDSTHTLTIGAIAVNWRSGTIWVGTGEVNSSRSSYAGTGLFKSTDRGRSWRYIGLPESHHIGKIQLHPTDDNTAWVAVLGHLYSPNRERGVYKTTDGGASWKQTLYVDDNTGVVDIDINPQDPRELYASAWYRTRRANNFVASGAGSGLFKSTDGGDTWKRVPGLPSGEHVGRMGVAVYPKNPKIVYIVFDNQTPSPDTTLNDTTKYYLRNFKNITLEEFARIDARKLDSFLKRNNLHRRYTAKYILESVSNGTLKPNALYDYLYVNTGFETTPIGAEVYRSDDAGASWRKTNQKPLPIFSSYGYYFGKIFVSPADDKKVVLTGFNIDLSTDGGATFKHIDKEHVHADHHYAWIDPARDSHIFDANDGGLNITYDNGEHWFKANTPAVGQFYSVTVDDAKPYNVYGGLQDNGVWYGPSTNRESMDWLDNGSYPYKQIVGGDGMQVQVDPRDNTTTYAGSQFGAYSRFNRAAPQGTYKRITPVHALGERPYRFNWQTPVLLSKHNPDIVYFGGNKLFRSFSKADTLIPVSPDMTRGDGGGNVPYGTITTIAESPLRFSLLYTGTDDGRLHRSDDAGYNWKALDEGDKKSKVKQQLPRGLWVSRIIASRWSEPRVYAALNGYRNDDFRPYLYVSEDRGATWTAIGTDLPYEPVNVVREDPKNPDILYVGTDGGIYVSFNRGRNFMAWTAGIPLSVPVHDIAIQERENELVLGTHGRSLYIAKLEDVQGLQKDPDWLKKKEARAKEKKAPATEEKEPGMPGEED
ncbi:glycosyl hydrolase [Flaviaesturariibacter flavus]|uniref:Glycosyl hydrolase n=1 Tax=Flaviaesturariibacter flavus TaxID=2502780 RepID=A0A4R1B342_9BACT|nr:glycosyl hydrolase [Flaviaesturariibacter flavus]TCJ12492.1 glycosyl hydrolase [Flaviaesturariibacter flavus]